MSAHVLSPAPTQIYGRDQELAILRAFLDGTSGAACLALVGQGGIGKTRLLTALLAMLQERNWPMPNEIYDFYHIDNFRSSQIERAIIRTFAPYSGDQSHKALTAYDAEYKKLDRARQSGHQFTKAKAATRQAFVTWINICAEELRATGRGMVLIFDTVEQAMNLPDAAEEYLLVEQRNASDGGEFWLTEIIPQLNNILVVLSGRLETLHNKPIDLFERLGLPPSAIMRIEPLQQTYVRKFVTDIRNQMLADTNPTIRGFADAVILSDELIELMTAVSGGLPFWLAVLFTCEMFAAIPPYIDRLRGQLRLQKQLVLSVAERREATNALMSYLLRDFRATDSSLVLVLQWMAALRKGLSQAALQDLAQTLNISLDSAEIVATLRRMLVVKTRSVAIVDVEGHESLEERFFLHDEMYRGLDNDPSIAKELRPDVIKTILQRYTQQIEQLTQAQESVRKTVQNYETNSPERNQLETTATRINRQVQQLILERLGYLFVTDFTRGNDEYNLRVFSAISNHESGYSGALHQEALRNSYWLQHEIPAYGVVESAARCVLQAWAAEDYRVAVQMTQQLQRYRTTDAAGVHHALLYLVEGIALSSYQPEQHEDRIFEVLGTAERLLQPYTADDFVSETLRWVRFLFTQIYNFQGYGHRLFEHYYAAIGNYTRSLRYFQLIPGELPDFRANVLNNLGYVYALQGDSDQARYLARQGLALRLLHSSMYGIGLSYNTLARIEIMAGNPQRARHYAEQAWGVFTLLDSPRGKSMALPVYAETFRKEGEMLDDSPPMQNKTFGQAERLFREAEELLEQEQIKNIERRREVYQGLGCTFRSRGQARRRREPTDPAKDDFHAALGYLNKALEIIMAVRNEDPNLPLDQKLQPQTPSLALLDINEDIAVIHINQDEYDDRIKWRLDRARGYAPAEYLLREGEGFQSIEAPTKGYWRELGQCALQEMMNCFGCFDFGRYRTEGAYANPTRLLEDPPHANEQYLEGAAEHMVEALAYIYQYSQSSPMFEKIKSLALRELLFNRSRLQLQRMQRAAYRKARAFKLLDTDAYRIVEELLRVAEEGV